MSLSNLSSGLFFGEFKSLELLRLQKFEQASIREEEIKSRRNEYQRVNKEAKEKKSLPVFQGKLKRKLKLKLTLTSAQNDNYQYCVEQNELLDSHGLSQETLDGLDAQTQQQYAMEHRRNYGYLNQQNKSKMRENTIIITEYMVPKVNKTITYTGSKRPVMVAPTDITYVPEGCTVGEADKKLSSVWKNKLDAAAIISTF